mmetsp:Transcript_7013/g.17406  ORF Transcript_7013/g.17406 Transcript_7013/m.17406 type:complete len:199 (+) Transcript_7013:341-937(+)
MRSAFRLVEDALGVEVRECARLAGAEGGGGRGYDVEEVGADDSFLSTYSSPSPSPLPSKSVFKYWMPTSPSRDDVVDDGGWEDVVDGAQVWDDGGIDSGGDRQEAYDAEYNILPPPQEEGAGYAKEAHYAEYAVGKGVDDRSAMSYSMGSLPPPLRHYEAMRPEEEDYDAEHLLRWIWSHVPSRPFFLSMTYVRGVLR